METRALRTKVQDMFALTCRDDDGRNIFHPAASEHGWALVSRSSIPRVEHGGIHSARGWHGRGLSLG